jgi:hypothetical protein
VGMTLELDEFGTRHGNPALLFGGELVHPTITNAPL